MKIYHCSVVYKDLGDYLAYDLSLLQSYYVGVPELPYMNDLFLDSGAFSAFRKKKEVDIDAYMVYLHENMDGITQYASLDVIGDPVSTWKNQRTMEKNGLSPLPCFHHGEDLKWLHKYIDKYEHFALGGMVPIAGNRRVLSRWLDMVWKEIPEDIKIHGYGIQGVDIIERYPWHSVDSSSCQRAASFGEVMSPWGRITVSTMANPNYKEKTRTPLRKKRIHDWIRENMPAHLDYDGLFIEDIKGTYHRLAFNIDYMKRKYEDQKKGAPGRTPKTTTRTRR